ncbi:hypothetical protein [Roseateles sp. LYH14W]|uniref:DUF4864 domain-containing protein n=1 Tax=Pelomonas parva TaxID=3299032 RepID=A0ABW7FAM5_9BURK
MAPMKRLTLLYAAPVILAMASFAQCVMAMSADGKAFVAQFREAAARPGSAALADLAELPFLFEGRAHQRRAFIDKVVPALFTPRVRQCLQQARPQPEGARFVLWCKPYAFYLGPVRGRWRLIEFGVDVE